eukprot:5279915-Amphidinium_carterae.1
MPHQGRWSSPGHDLKLPGGLLPLPLHQCTEPPSLTAFTSNANTIPRFHPTCHHEQDLGDSGLIPPTSTAHNPPHR